MTTYLPPRKGARQFRAILDALHPVQARLDEPDYGSALGYLAARLRKRSLIVLFTELAGEEASERLLSTLLSLVPRHLPLVLTQRDRVMEAVTVADVADEHTAFSAAIAEDLLRDKASALRRLTARGALALDVDAENLPLSAVERYLDVKARGLL